MFCFAVVVYCSKLGVCPKDWNCHRKKNNGRHDFQIDLGLAVLNHAIVLDWDGDERPDYMRTGDSYPCNCMKCYFCINGHTTGIRGYTESFHKKYIFLYNFSEWP